MIHVLESLLRSLFIKWLRERALVVPSSKREEIAKRLRVDQEVVDAILNELKEAILQAIVANK